MSTNNPIEIVKALENAVHKHSKRIRSIRRRLREYRRGTITGEELRDSLNKLIRSSRKLERIFTLLRDALSTAQLDAETSERIHLLAFFVYEVAVNEELDLWKRISGIPELSFIVGDVDTHISRLERLRELASAVLAGTKLAD